MNTTVRELLTQALGDLRRSWPQLVLTDLLARAVAVAIIAPSIGLLGKLFLRRTETGVVTVISIRSVYEIGQQVNPALVAGQIQGGSFMGMAHALYETTAPYYPAVEYAPTSFNEYVLPGPAELPEMESVVLEYPPSNGPYGVKGVGEMTANSPIPAIVNAIYNAVGVRIMELPVTPEKVLRALEKKKG